VPTNTRQSLTCDNLVSDCSGSPTMSSTVDVGSGKESVTTIEDLAKRFTFMEDRIRPLQPLLETVKNLVE
jgi:hypothetical protein